MAIRYAVATGNWNNVAIWDGGATLPSAGDDVYANGYTVYINQDITVTKISTEICPSTGVGGGGFSLTNVAYIINSNVVAGTTPCIPTQTSYSTNPYVIIGNIYGGTAAGARGIDGSTRLFNIIGNVYGGSASNANGIYVTAGSWDITGNVYGGSGAFGCFKVSSGYVYNYSVVGNLVAGAYAAMRILQSISVNITGIIQASSAANGLIADSTTTGVFLNGRMICSTYFAVWTDKLFFTSSGLAVTIKDGLGNDYNLYTADVLENPPAESDVRSGVVYGIEDAYEGTLAVPPPSTVNKGVPTDNTVGSWAFDNDLIARLENNVTENYLITQLGNLTI